MIHGHPRRRAGRRIKMFFKHAALVFAYTAYISIAALIVLKMAARGGYADQVGMTHPLARLFMIAIISAVAIGVFWWLKRELGDHTRQDLTHLVTELSHRARDGYQRGHNAVDRARDLNARAPWSKTQAADQQDSPKDPDQPLTGPPADGRPPGGRPPSPGRLPRPAPAGPGPAGAAATSGAGAATKGATGAAASSGAGQAAAAVIAPEAVAGAAVASHLTQRLHRDHNTRGGQPTRAQPHPASPGDRTSSPASHQPAAAPVAGRTNNTRPTTAQRPNPTPSGRDHPNTRPHPDPGDIADDAPVQGR